MSFDLWFFMLCSMEFWRGICTKPDDDGSTNNGWRYGVWDGPLYHDCSIGSKMGGHTLNFNGIHN